MEGDSCGSKVLEKISNVLFNLFLQFKAERWIWVNWGIAEIRSFLISVAVGLEKSIDTQHLGTVLNRIYFPINSTNWSIQIKFYQSISIKWAKESFFILKWARVPKYLPFNQENLTKDISYENDENAPSSEWVQKWPKMLV